MSDNGHAPSRPKPPASPSAYDAAARKLHREILANWVLDAAGSAILDTALRAATRGRQAQALIRRDGLVGVDRFGQRKLHPAVLVERDAASTFLTAMRQLGLDLEPLRDAAGRPPGRSGR